MEARPTPGEASVFLHKSFSRKSFKPESWAPFSVVIPPVSGGGGSGSAGVAGYKLPSAIEYEDDIRSTILREDDEVLAVIMAAVTSGALKWVH